MIWDRRSVPAIITPWLRLVEANRLTAYQDGGGVWTVGTGSTTMPSGRRVQHGDTITQAQADAMLAAQIKTVRIPPILRVIPASVPLTEAMAAMLIDLIYEDGVGALAPGNVVTDMLAAGLLTCGFGQFPGWCIATQNGVRGPSLGVLRRRVAGQRIALGAPIHPTYEQVWRMGLPDLLPLYDAACKDAADYRGGVVTWEVHQTAPAAKPVASPQLTADELDAKYN